MLSRVADALYWMGRYVERAEHAARLLGVTHETLIDLDEVDPEGAEQLWRGSLSALTLDDRTLENAVFDDREPGSILSSVSRARENARQVREVVSSEMWEHLNQAYWSLNEAAASRGRGADVVETLRQLITSTYLWSGVADATMRRGEGWVFTRIGQFVERAEKASRLVAVRSRALESRPTRANGSGENVVLATLLRSLSALEAYRKVHPTRLATRDVIGFLVLDRDFPRTVRYAVTVAAELVGRLPANGSDRAVERTFGRLSARLAYADTEELLAQGADAFLEQVLVELGEASLALQRAYFLH